MRFEYLVVSDPGEQNLNVYGKDGWELVGIHANRYVFKRELQTSFFDIWSAASATEPVELHAKDVCAYDFQEACDSHANLDPHFAHDYDRENLTFGGCKLYDNQAAAEKGV